MTATRRYTTTVRAVWWVGLAAVAILPHLVAAKSAVASWQPLTKDNEWTYGVSRAVTVTGGPLGTESVKLTGTATTTVLGASKLFRGRDPVFEVETTTQEQSQGGRGQGRSTTQTSHVATTATGIYLHGQTLVGAPGVSTNLVTYRPPLHLLLLPEASGARWTVGEARLGAMRMAMGGEIAGFENVAAPTRTYTRCLKVRYTATVSGDMTDGKNSYPITGGSAEIVDWYAPGVGLVKETTTFRIQYAGDRDARMTSTQTGTRILTRASVK